MKRAAAAAATVLILAGCGGNDESGGPTLQALSDGSTVGSEHPDTPIGTSVLLPIRPLCTSGAPITITGVTPQHGTGGLAIATWGTRRVLPGDEIDNGRAGGPGRVDGIPGYGHHAVSVRCGAKSGGAFMQFAVSLTAKTPRATATGVVLHYGDGRRAFAQYGVAVCSTATCRRV